MVRAYLRQYLFSPLSSLLAQGVTPARITLSMAAGITIGLFPIVGTTTAMCIIAAITFRMNLLVIQLGNWIVYPLQFALIVPFLILGEKIFGTGSNMAPAQVAALMRTDILLAIQTVSRMIIHAAIAWALCAPLVFLLVYAVLLPVFSGMHARIRDSRPR